MPLVTVLATGGTIASRSGAHGATAQDDGADLVGRLSLPAGVEVRVRDVVRVGGFRMTLDRVHEVARAVATELRDQAVAGVVITHGTDTMTETAAALRNIPEKVIVFTGSMVPARFRSSDALFNLGCAVGALQVLPPGIYIAMNGRISPAETVKKNRAQSRFEPKADQNKS